jgi:hypothetical protein
MFLELLRYWKNCFLLFAFVFSQLVFIYLSYIFYDIFGDIVRLSIPSGNTVQWNRGQTTDRFIADLFSSIYLLALFIAGAFCIFVAYKYIIYFWDRVSLVGSIGNYTLPVVLPFLFLWGFLSSNGIINLIPE